MSCNDNEKPQHSKNSFTLAELLEGAEIHLPEDDFMEEEEKQYPYEDVVKFCNFDALDADGDDINVTSFATLRTKMTDVTEDGKIKKLVKQQGIGDIVPPESIVYIHYYGHHCMNEMPFDSTYLRRNKPERHQLGVGDLIKGLDIGLLTMRKGETSQLLMEPEYAFGEFGCPPRVPPSATVLFTVELMNFVDPAKEEFVEGMYCPDKRDFTFVEEAARKTHVAGNNLFKNNNVRAAIKRYEAAVNLLTGCRLKNEEEEIVQKKLLIKLYTNLSVCFKKLKEPKRVCIACRDAMYFDAKSANGNVKLLYNWGCSLLTLGEFKRSGEKLNAALALEPNNQAIKDELIKLDIERNSRTMEAKIGFPKPA